MGSCTSDSASDLYDDKRMTLWEKQFFALKLTKSEIVQLFKEYRKIDLDDSGYIELDDLMVFINTIEISYALRVFSMFDGI
jgi:Ca2+-binding EF-hand superfamily protein